MTLTRLQYVDACLSAISAPHNNVQHVSMMTRITYEWGDASNHGPSFNALDLTQIEGGCTPFNSFGPVHQYHVWNYPNLAAGVKAFYDIMQGRQYLQVLHLLQAGGKAGAYEHLTADQLISEWNLTHWSSPIPLSLVTQTRKEFNHYAALLVKE